MTEKLQETIKKEVGELPKEMREAIASVDWVKITEEIGKKYSLSEEETNNFQLETLLLLTSITDPEFYAINIENQVNIGKDTAEKMSEEAFTLIFVPIKKIVVEKAKNNIKNKNPNWQQTLDFILSGGDYVSFLGNPTETGGATDTLNISRNKIQDIKSKLVI